MKINNNKGFSLIELLVALSILAVVAAIIVPRFLNVRTQAGEAAGLAQIQEFKRVYDNFVGVGGTTTAASGTGDILRFLSNTTGARAALNGVADNTGAINSSGIALGGITWGAAAGVSASDPTAGSAPAITQGWYTTTATGGTSSYYSDGQGDVWKIASSGVGGTLTATQILVASGNTATGM